MITYLKYVLLAEVGSYLANGWTIADDLAGTHHGAHAILMIATKDAWLPVVGWDGLYEVSFGGNVRSLDRMMVSQNAVRGYPRRMKGRVLTPKATPVYLSVTLHSPDGHASKRYVSHLVAEAWIGPRPENMEVCHEDGNRFNNAADNLRYGSHASNENDKDRHGTRYRGEQAYQSKLKNEQVRTIRRLSVTTDHKILAKRFGVSVNLIDWIVNRRIWTHLPPEPGEVGTAEADARKKENISRWRSNRMSSRNRFGKSIGRVPLRGEGEPG